VKKLIITMLLTTSASAAELPQYEVSGFPITLVQTNITGATAYMREMMPAAPGLSPVQSLLLGLREVPLPQQVLRASVPPVQAHTQGGEK
jgi:hypothetical protein